MRSFTFKNVLTTLMLLFSMTAFAQTSVCSTTIEDNTMFFNVSNPDFPFTAAQFDLKFEGGIGVVTDGEYYDVFLGSRTSSRNHSAPECSVQPDGSLRVVILSLKNKLFEGSEGDIAQISLDATGVANGVYQYSITNILFADPDSQSEYAAEVQGWLNVNDGVITIGTAPVTPEPEPEPEPAVLSTASAEQNGSELLVNISNPSFPFTAIQFDLYLTGGVSVVTDGEYYDVFLGSRTSSRNHSDPECNLQPDGSLRVVILSLQNKLFSGTEGDIASISLNLDGVVDGTYAYQIKNIVLSDPDSQAQAPADFEGSIIVGTGVTPEPDYSAEIAALRALVAQAQSTHDAAVEGTAAGEYPAGAKAALQAVIDTVNASINDAMTLETINACTEQINAAVAEFQGKVIVTPIVPPATMSVVSAVIDADNTMYVNVSNPSFPFTAIQFDLKLEGGIGVVTDGEYYDVFLGSRTSSRNHSAPECSVQPDGSLRVVILSLQNKLFSGTEGDVATISLDLTGVVDGTYAYQIKNIALSDPDSQLQYPADFEGSIIVGTGVTPEPDYSAEIAALRALVAQAQSTHDAAVEGTANGEYPAGAKAALQAVIDAVNASINDAMTLEAINACTEQINAAVAEFEGKVITNAGDGDDDEPIVDANNTLSIANTVARAGRQVALSVCVDNVAEIAGVEFSLYLPDGFSLSTDSRGRYILNKTERCDDGAWTVSSNLVGDHYNIAMLDADLYGFTGNEGAVLEIMVDVAEGVADGYHSIVVKGIELSDVNANAYKTTSATSEVYVYSYIIGDVNDDGEYSTNDAVNIVKLSLEEATAENYPVADVNYDGEISTNDAVNVVKWSLDERVPEMVFPEHSNEAPKKAAALSLEDENYLDIETIEINPGEEVEVPILLYYTHEDGITASEFDILLPEGITVKTDKKGRPVVSDGDLIDGHTTTKSYSGNKLKVKSLSLDLYTYYGDSGEILYTITLIADESLTDCELTLDLVNMELTAADDDLTAIKPADRQIKIVVGEGNTTGINGIASENAANNEAIYDLTGRKVTEMVKGGIYIKGGKKIFVK